MSAQDLKSRRTKAVEGMAAAMMEFIEASDEAAERRMDQRFAQVDASLREIWRHVRKGNGKLPIDS